MFGVLGKEFIYDFSEKLNSEAFIEFIKKIEHKFKKFVLFLDNASWHRSRAVKEFIDDQENIEFEFFPTYSPELNPVEPCWKQTKTAVSTRLFTNIEAYKEAIDEFAGKFEPNIEIYEYIVP
jgi:transposase